jgi:hypothetical protein
VILWVVLGACSTTVVPTSVPPSASIVVPDFSCQLPPTSPGEPLTCLATVAAVQHGLGLLASQATSYEFHYGFYCRPGDGCIAPRNGHGFVIVSFVSAPAVVVKVRANVNGIVEVTSIDDKAALDR